MANIALEDAPRLTIELIRDIIDLRITLALGQAAVVDQRLDAITAEILDQGCPEYVADEYRRVFGGWNRGLAEFPESVMPE